MAFIIIVILRSRLLNGTVVPLNHVPVGDGRVNAYDRDGKAGARRGINPLSGYGELFTINRDGVRWQERRWENRND